MCLFHVHAVVHLLLLMRDKLLNRILYSYNNPEIDAKCIRVFIRFIWYQEFYSVQKEIKKHSRKVFAIQVSY